MSRGLVLAVLPARDTLVMDYKQMLLDNARKQIADQKEADRKRWQDAEDRRLARCRKLEKVFAFFTALKEIEESSHCRKTLDISVCEGVPGATIEPSVSWWYDRHNRGNIVASDNDNGLVLTYSHMGGIIRFESDENAVSSLAKYFQNTVVNLLPKD